MEFPVTFGEATYKVKFVWNVKNHQQAPFQFNTRFCVESGSGSHLYFNMHLQTKIKVSTENVYMEWSKLKLLPF